MDFTLSDAQRLTSLYWKAAKELLLGLYAKGILVYHRKRGTDSIDTKAYFSLKKPKN